MSVKITSASGLLKQLEITVPADELVKAYQKKITQFSSKAVIKGFRPGKIPAAVAEKKFGQGLLYETASELMDTALQNAIRDHQLKVAGRPTVDADVQSIKKDADFTFKATVEVFPEFTLKDLTDVSLESLSGEVTDDDVTNRLVQLRTQHSEWIPVSRTAKLGDRLNIDFDGEMDGKPLEKGSAKHQKLILGSKNMIAGFEDGLIGVKKDDKLTLFLTFPKDYHVDNLRDKPVQFAIVVHEVEEPKLPALDDAFAKKAGVEGGVDALKTKIKERMQQELNDAAKALLKKEVLEQLQTLNTIEVPPALIETEIQHLQRMTRQQFRQFNPSMKEADINKLPLTREPFEAEAKKRVLLGLLLAEVVRHNNIKADQNRVRERLENIAAQYGDVSQVLPILLKNKSMISEVEAFILEEQAVDILLSKARVSESKKSYDAIMNAEKASQSDKK